MMKIYKWKNRKGYYCFGIKEIKGFPDDELDMWVIGGQWYRLGNEYFMEAGPYRREKKRDKVARRVYHQIAKKIYERSLDLDIKAATLTEEKP